jgi:hypothetical protein
MSGRKMTEKVAILTIEVGSTVTKVNGFNRLRGGGFKHIGQGFAPTSISHGDVGLGVDQAIACMLNKYPVEMGDPETFVNSSAAGGLRMTVHGLTVSMTARAAREAALGAGGIVQKITAGELDEYDLEEIHDIRPNIILLAGGVDFGEKEIVLRNAWKLAELRLNVPVLYAGNQALAKTVEKIFQEADTEIKIAANVFPEVDVLNIEPVRKIIHEMFNRHIIHAPGMSRYKELTKWGIYPTPGAVLKAAELFAEAVGDVLVVDVGGATTDVHSVTEGSMEWSSRLIEPEPTAKRTVEGDLGVYINAARVIALEEKDFPDFDLSDLVPIPDNERQFRLTNRLCQRAVDVAVRRHAGTISDLYTPSGRKQIVRGKDLTAIKWVIGTGGALTLIRGGEEILRSICKGAGQHLLPPPEANILLDDKYRFSALGTLAQAYPEDVKQTFRLWIEAIDQNSQPCQVKEE